MDDGRSSPERFDPEVLSKLVAALALVVLLTSCGTSDDPPAASSGSASGAPCGFSGSTTPTTVAAPVGAPTTLTGIVPQAAGCIDQLTFNFSPSVPAASIAYGPVSSEPQLVVTFGGPGAAGAAGTTVSYGGSSSPSAKNLTDITSIDVKASSDGSVVVTLGLSTSQLAFDTSSSAVPAAF